MGQILRYSYIFITVAVALGGASPASAQDEPGERPLSLRDAVAEALERNGDLRAARARTEAARAGVRSASAFLYPGVSADAGVTTSDDPVAVFGTKLRQERFADSDFAIDALNRPDPVSDWTAGVGARWRLGDPAAWAEREAVRLEAAAAELGLDRQREAVAFRAEALYLGALAARAEAAAADTALEAARASLAVVRARRDEGFLTDADLLQAEAEVAAARARRSDAGRRAEDARARLGVHLGWSADTVPRLTDRLLAEARDPPAGSAADVERRADLRALERSVEAAGARVSQARRGRLPALETFGRLSRHAGEITGDRTLHWTVGLQVSVPIFTGFALEGAADRARAGRRAAEAERRQRILEAEAEVREARRAVESAREGSEAAGAAARAASEARALMRRRFEEGMATTADLLRADARAAAMASRAIEARTMLRIAGARLEFARGTRINDEQSDGEARDDER